MATLSEIPPAPSQGAAMPEPGETTRIGGTDPTGLPLERVEAELCTLAGPIAAATSRFLVLLADFDAREGWAGWGVHSCAHWLSWRCGLGLHTAHEHVRVARALVHLPQIGAAFAQGRVSYSKVRAVTRVATAETESELLEAALSSPAAHPRARSAHRPRRRTATPRPSRQPIRASAPPPSNPTGTAHPSTCPTPPTSTSPAGPTSKHGAPTPPQPAPPAAGSAN